jgi:hypothetical protein
VVEASPMRGDNRKLFGVSKLLFHPTLAADAIGMGLNEATAVADDGKVDGMPATTNTGPPVAERSISEV